MGIFVLLYVVKSIKQIALAFPIVIAACIPIRIYLLPKWFDQAALALLDGEDEDVEHVLQENAKQGKGDEQHAPALDGEEEDVEQAKEAKGDEQHAPAFDGEDEDIEQVLPVNFS